MSDDSQKVTLQESQELAQREPYSEGWWLHKHQTLLEAFQIDPTRGLDEWFTVFADALLAWQLDGCRQLASEPFLSLPEAINLRAHFQQGIQGILAEEYLLTSLLRRSE